MEVTAEMGKCKKGNGMIAKIISGVVALLGVFSWLFSDWTLEHKIIATQFFIVAGFAIYTITNMHNKKVNENATITDEFADIDWKELLSDAKHDVFVSSAALYNTTKGSKSIKKWVQNKNHTLRLLSLDASVYDEYVQIHHPRCQDDEKDDFDLVAYKKMFLQHLGEMIIVSGNVHEREISGVMICAFIAIDCGIEAKSFTPEKHSRIIAFFYLPDKLALKSVIKIVATQGTELYNTFKKEIEFYWSESESPARGLQIQRKAEEVIKQIEDSLTQETETFVNQSHSEIRHLNTEIEQSVSFVFKRVEQTNDDDFIMLAWLLSESQDWSIFCGDVQFFLEFNVNRKNIKSLEFQLKTSKSQKDDNNIIVKKKIPHNESKFSIALNECAYKKMKSVEEVCVLARFSEIEDGDCNFSISDLKIRKV